MKIAKQFLKKFRYGKEIIVVSGLPRSGTSMLMNMLASGGMEVVSDRVRESDPDNPKGYFEDERVKDLEKDPDKSWLRAARGRTIKVISHLLKDLPDENYYKVILLRRNLEEIVASQNKMLDRRGEPNPIGDDKAIEAYRNHLINTKVFLRRAPNFEVLELQYTQVIQDPFESARKVNEFLGGLLDVGAMASVVDSALYRNRKEKSQRLSLS
ncbi:MAG: sulfotransferase [Methylococcaceae bacterium]|nr:sulfotransferase [Methylococcaceae bacterium]MCI0732909.1 sulfotransferase [Methylococcaceae bacterium]